MELHISPIGTRYRAPNLTPMWTRNNKCSIMRQLWTDLAIIQKDLGIDIITDEGIKEMQDNRLNINFNKIDEYENKFKHDIIAHIHEYSDLCPKAKPFIHLGATSNFINDNVDMIIIKDSLNIINTLLYKLFNLLKAKSYTNIDVPTLAYTHLQQAQLTTIGKRFAMWNSDISIDIEQLKYVIDKLPFRGIKGTTGTEDTILKLFEGDHSKCDLLNEKLAKHYGFENAIIICGQTYSRKYDVMVFQIISSICQSIYKMMNDIRLLSGKGEIFEHFGKDQVGSSAMPYKKNPITCEKICSLARYVINQESAMSQTYINQWLERSLDDSAIKRIIYPECFILLEHILNETVECIDKIVINTDHIKKEVAKSMHNIITEELIINGVKMGYNRIDIHERIRSILTKPMKDYDEDNVFMSNLDNLSIIKKIFEKDGVISKILINSKISMDPSDYIGRCSEQIIKYYE